MKLKGCLSFLLGATTVWLDDSVIRARLYALDDCEAPPPAALPFWPSPMSEPGYCERVVENQASDSGLSDMSTSNCSGDDVYQLAFGAIPDTDDNDDEGTILQRIPDHRHLRLQQTHLRSRGGSEQPVRVPSQPATDEDVLGVDSAGAVMQYAPKDDLVDIDGPAESEPASPETALTTVKGDAHHPASRRRRRTRVARVARRWGISATDAAELVANVDCAQSA